VALAIQRNDGRYLGLDGSWQTTPHWHPQFSAEPDTGGLRIELGPALIDGIVALHGQPLLLVLRLDGHEDRGVLRVRGSLIGSNAAATTEESTLARRPIPPGDGRLESEQPRISSGQSVANGDDEPLLDHVDINDIALPPRSRRRWPLGLGAGLVILLLGGGFAAWSLGWLDQLIARRTAETPQEQPQGFLPSPDSTLTGRAFAVDLLAEGPPGDAVFAAAEARAEAGDCDAALILYARAADVDPAIGAAVARLYDPASFAQGGCIDEANEEMALEYYRVAAEAGVPAAMRRAGEILVGRAESGPVYDEGRDWLQRAAATR
jgi:hypothetical protein